MSFLEQLGARLQATADNLPFDAVEVAAERLRVATDLLMWVRRSSANPLGVPSLTHATEHLEQATYALRISQDTIGDYLASIGLAYQSSPTPDRSGRPADTEQPTPQTPDERAGASALGRWWESRVNWLAEHEEENRDGERPQAGANRGGSRGDAATSSTELLRQTARQVQAGDRDRLRAELGTVEAPVGLGLSALTPPVLRRLATELLGHPPGPNDLSRLDGETRSRVRELMPRMPEHVVREQLARVCRSPAAGSSGEPTHPTDAAVAGALLTGILLDRLGQSPDSLRPAEDEQSGRPGTRTAGPDRASGTAGPDRGGHSGRPRRPDRPDARTGADEAGPDGPGGGPDPGSSSDHG